MSTVDVLRVIYGKAYRYPNLEGDTRVLNQSVDFIIQCMQNKSLFCPCIVHFPLFQYISTFILQYFAGNSSEDALRNLVIINFWAFLGILGIALIPFRRRGQFRHGAFICLMILGSPLLWYTKSSFNEMTAAFVTLLYSVACIQYFTRLENPRLWAPLLVVSMIMAGITKEVALPFLWVIALTCLGVRYVQQRRKLLMPLVMLTISSGIILGLNGGFNIWRFGSPWNTALLDPLFQVHNVGQQMIFFWSIWFSPNGGLVFFWPAFTGLVGWVVWSCWSHCGIRQPWHWLPLAGVELVLLGLTSGFSKWYAPFGWWAWGTRLMYPWIPSLILLLVFFFKEEVDQILAFLGRRDTISMVVLALLLASAGLQWGALLSNEAITRFSAPDEGCAKTAIIQTDADMFYQCMNRLLWSDQVLLLKYQLQHFLSKKAFVHYLPFFVFYFGMMMMVVFPRTRYRQADGLPMERDTA
jgi:hypothetical protein